jgi:prepilin-type N-terminal cleavage/methylation domain-containing protein/prepilin-type processing-associated H-X9-DG protein
MIPPHDRSPAHRVAAFTLIETLVSVAVIAVLASLIVPMATNGIKRAQESGCLNNLRQIGVATELFTQEYNGYMPDLNWWAGELLPYVNETSREKNIFWCPATTLKESPLNASGNLSRYPDGAIIPISYGLNGNYPSNDGKITTGNEGNRVPVRRKLNVPNPSKVVLFLDSTGGFANVFFNTRDRFSRRHARSKDPNRMQLNALFVDGHVEPLDMQYSDAMRSPWRATFDTVWK